MTSEQTFVIRTNRAMGLEQILSFYEFEFAILPEAVIAAAPALLSLAKQYAGECSNCDGTGLMNTMENDRVDLPLDRNRLRV